MDNSIYNSANLLDHRHNSPVACRSMQLGEGHRQNSAVARNERFSLASGRQVRQDRNCKVLSILSSHCPPPWGLWCFWGSYLPVAPPKNSADTVPQKLQANKTYGYLTGGNLPTDLKKRTAVLTPAKGIFHPNFSGKKGPEKFGSL